MIKEVIKNCPVTLSDSTVLMPFIDTKSNIWYNRNGGYHTGIDLLGIRAYSICAGVCTFIGYSTDEKNVVIIQYDRNVSFRYCNLTTVLLSKGRTVDYQELVGYSSDYIHFEAITLSKSPWKVRVGNLDYYKTDPLDYANGTVDYSASGNVENFIFYDVDPDIQTIF